MGIRSNLKKQALQVSQVAMEKLLSDRDRAAKVAQLVGSVQRGKQSFDKAQQDLMRVFQVAPKADFQALNKQLAGLKRRIRTLDAKLGKATGKSKTSG